MDPEKDVFEDPSTSEPEGSGTPAGNQGGTPEGQGRSLDNIYKEFDRKTGNLSAEVAAIKDAVGQLVDVMRETRQGATPNTPPNAPRPQAAAPQYGAPPMDLSQYSDSDLQLSLSSGKLNPDTRRQVERELDKRSLASRMDEQISQREQQRERDRLKAEAEDAALKAFPALRESTSEFARRVDAVLQQRRQVYGETPTDKYDVANQVAREMGVEVSRVVAPGFVGRPEPVNQPEPEPTVQGPSDERLRQIAQNLQYALPLRRDPKTGKMKRKKFNLKRLKERSQEYAEHSAIYHGGRKIGGR